MLLLLLLRVGLLLWLIQPQLHPLHLHLLRLLRRLVHKVSGRVVPQWRHLHLQARVPPALHHGVDAVGGALHADAQLLGGHQEVAAEVGVAAIDLGGLREHQQGGSGEMRCVSAAAHGREQDAYVHFGSAMISGGHKHQAQYQNEVGGGGGMVDCNCGIPLKEGGS